MTEAKSSLPPPITAAEMRATFDRITANYGALHRWQADVLELLHELVEHFDNFADADQPAGCDHPIPNAAMNFQVECERLIAKARQ